MNWKFLRNLAIIYVIAEMFLTPDFGIMQTHAQASCSISSGGSTAPLLGVQTADKASITGGCIDNVALGQNTAIGATTIGGTVNLNGANNQFGSASGVPAHVNTGSTTAPGLGSCGGGSPAITGTDTAGIVTMGTSASGCVITFNVAYTGTPYCVVTWIATPLASQSYVTAHDKITLTQTSTSSNVVQYVCIGPAGG